MSRHASWPPLLSEIANPPKSLAVIGQLPEDRPCVAIVGSRKFSRYGEMVTSRLAYDLAKAGIVIVSGLALGIDSIAHRSALEAGGTTIGVLACGLDQVYPSSNRTLAKRMIEAGGALVSEYPEGMPPLKQNFPARNRIIAGLSLATLVTEAAAHSGALITAGFALEADRLVMAVPGNINSLLSAGTNNLLKAGAIAVTEARDVLLALDLEVPTLKAKIAKPASKQEAVILELMANEIFDSEDLIAQSGFDTAQFNQVITLMEISGKVRNIGAGRWIAT